MAWGRSQARPRGRRGWAFPTKAPHHWSYLIALVLAALGVIGTRTHIDGVSSHAFYLVLAAYVLLALACVINGL